MNEGELNLMAEGQGRIQEVDQERGPNPDQEKNLDAPDPSLSIKSVVENINSTSIFEKHAAMKVVQTLIKYVLCNHCNLKYNYWI